MIWEFIKSHGPKKIYAEDLFLLAEAAKGPKMGMDVSKLLKEGQSKSVHLLPISCQNCREISQIETDKEVIFNGMVDGASRVLEVFGPIVGIDTDEARHQTLMEIFPALAIRDASRVSTRGTLKDIIRKATRGWLGLGSSM